MRATPPLPFPVNLPASARDSDNETPATPCPPPVPHQSVPPVRAACCCWRCGRRLLSGGPERATPCATPVAVSQSLARTLADHTSFTLRQTDHATQLFKLKYEETDGGLRLNEFTRRQGLLDSVLPSKLELPIALIDAQGNVVDSAHAYLPENLATQPFFKALAANASDTALVDTPMLDADGKRWTIPGAPPERCAGPLAAPSSSTSTPRICRRLRRLNLDEHARCAGGARQRPDGGAPPAAIDHQRPHRLPHAGSAAARPRNLIDPPSTRRRHLQLPRLPRYPLLAVVGVSRAAALARFEHRRLCMWARCSPPRAHTGLRPVMRQSARLRRSIRQATETQALLRAAPTAARLRAAAESLASAQANGGGLHFRRRQ